MPHSCNLLKTHIRSFTVALVVLTALLKKWGRKICITRRRCCACYLLALPWLSVSLTLHFCHSVRFVESSVRGFLDGGVGAKILHDGESFTELSLALFAYVDYCTLRF